MIKLSDYIAKRLKEVYNVEHFFMVSGGGAMHLNDSLGRYIPYIANHHEQACAIAAEGYARVNQRLAVVNVTTGPGGLNCLNGVFGQWTDSVPVLYISGQVKFSTTMASCPEIPLRQLGDQEVDIISVVKPLTKYAKMVTEPNEIKYHLDKAIHEATTGRFGPVWLDIPMNVQATLIEEDKLIEFKHSDYSPFVGTSKSSILVRGKKAKHFYTKQSLEYSKVLRKNMTDAENILWHYLRNKQLDNLKFRRQEAIDNYIADFVCYEKKFIIELDGCQHLEKENVIYDEKRDEYFKKQGFDVLRIYNNDVFKNIEGAIESILDKIYPSYQPSFYTPHSNPLPQGEREKKTETWEIIQKINSAKRPLIIAGHGIRLSKQKENFYKLLEKLQIPVVTTFNGFDLLEDKHPDYIGRIGTVGQRAGNFALQNADLVLCLGTRNNIRQASYNWENFAKNAYKIVVDIDQAELDKPTVLPDMKICADLAEFLPNLLEYINCHPEFISGSNPRSFNGKMLKQVQHEVRSFNWLNWCQNLKQKFSIENFNQYEQKDIIDPYIFSYELTKAMGEGDIMVMANGSACVCPFQTAIVKKGQRYILNSGDASMGYDLPAAIGACLEGRGRNTICLVGDGSIMMNLQELQTIKHHHLPIKIFVIANQGYASIKQTQKNFFNGHMTGSGEDSGVSVPDFINIGKAFGIKTVKIQNPCKMKDKIGEVLDLNEPVICEVAVKSEYDFSPKLSSRKLEDGTMTSPSLEDMFPFLDRDKFKENIINIESTE